MEIDPLRIPAFMRKKSFKKTIDPVMLTKPTGAYPTVSRSVISAQPVAPARPVVARPVTPRPVIRIKPPTFMSPFMDAFESPVIAQPARPAKPAPRRVKPAPILTPVGVVTHYFDKIKVAVLQLNDALHVGARLQLMGADGPFKQKLTSMQINREPIEHASAGDDIGIKVKKAVTVGETVYLIG